MAAFAKRAPASPVCSRGSSQLSPSVICSSETHMSCCGKPDVTSRPSPRTKLNLKLSRPMPAHLGPNKE